MNSPDLDWVPDEDSFTANQIDLICDEFESIWKSEDRPQISDYLYRVEEPSRSALLVELVRLDYAYRLEKGETPSSEEYVSLFPDYSDVLLTRVNEFSSIGKEVSEAPSKIGDIELLEIAGFGAFGTVWKAWDLELKRQVAVKLPSNKLDGKQQVDLFLHEAQAAAKLHHPNIVPVYSSGQIDGRGYIVFKYIQGETLRALLNKQALAHEQAAQICLALAAGLDHAHQQGVIHRDLKPSNILIDETGQPHITDFGLAKRIDVTASLAHSGTVLGTIAYMSPEQAKGRSSEIEAHSDIYSLGAILYRMLTNQIPFEGEPHEVLQRIINQEPVAPRKIEPSIPRDLETICLKASSKQKRDRYQTAGEMAADLKRFLDKKPIQSRRVSKLGQLWRKIKQRPLAYSLLASVSCLLIFLGSQVLFPAPPPSDDPIVTLNTKPEGAQVAFIPLSKKNGEPMPEQIIHAETTSPVTLPLEPGDYLVVAYFDDERFHEVYRHVPEKHEGIPEVFAHREFRREKNNPNQITLPSIRIRKTQGVTKGMAYLEGANRVLFGGDGKYFLPHHDRSIPGFWMDTRELSVEIFTRLFDMKPNLQPTGREGPDYAVVLQYDMAVSLAEKQGKRLPTEFEWAYAATQLGTTRFSWGNQLAVEEFAKQNKFLPVGYPLFDQFPTTPPIFGLCSNVAEWTCTQVYIHPEEQLNFSNETPTSLKNYRVIRGGNESVIFDGNPVVDSSSRDPRVRCFVHRGDTHPGLGMRCVKSAYPRLKREDFASSLSQK
ncbi:bifunctional serine/threonine-protein kinase/formylglycine-generating enzyme family protein [Gimesia fumaroli]|uniref:non-specific serine/threonine protein kinase n=1 Tax=Gimesia fumaroli TaxID=2527976 RepID=A0A518IF67_9PLAN|nr:bifunctional serine/threonine-protein kinase/formylglycine-generating enzyme family protein [Gimesia fumaroli]QDV51743.1 Serine/threonine-protein kinase PrkC [Gimesia fumaroli]